MQREKRALKGALSSDLSYNSPKVMPLKPILTRTNSENHKRISNISKNPFSRDRSNGFRASFRASFRRKAFKAKPILKKTTPFTTLKEYIPQDDGLLLSCYRVSTDIDERINERKRTKYRNPYKDFDALEYERKEKRFLSTMAYLFTFIVVLCVMVVTFSEMQYIKTALEPESILMSENQSNDISSSLAQDTMQFNLGNMDISPFFMPNDSRTKETISKKAADMRRQILRSRYGIQ